MQNKSFYDANKEITNPQTFTCLQGNDVITARVSDHHPVIHHDVLFWNIMMQGKTRNRKGVMSYNNGFCMEENEKQYVLRLVKVAQVIAEIIYRNPSIKIVGLCEGPIEPLHASIFLHALKSFRCMQRFLKNNQFYKPNVENHPHWGLLMLTDQHYHVSELRCDLLEKSDRFNALANRFQLWHLTQGGQVRYFALAHFPFGGDLFITKKSDLSSSANEYCQFINSILNQYHHDSFILCADFNFNPYLISQYNYRACDQITHHNSIVITTAEKSTKPMMKTVTVDGILLSVTEKQKHLNFLQPCTRLYEKLKNEYRFFKSCLDQSLGKNRHQDHSLQEEYDRQYGMVPS